MRRGIRYFLINMAVLAITSGCSGSSSLNSPASPELQLAGQNELMRFNSAANHYLWVYEFVFVDPQTLEYEVIQPRDIEAHWNVLTWLENGPCSSCFKLKSLVPSGTGTLLAEVQIRHPFPSKNLTGFDVRGIAMFGGGKTFPVSGLTTPDRSAGNGEVVNPDGYTTLYNLSTAGSGPDGLQGYQKGRSSGVPPTAKLNAYKRFITNNPANTRNAFYAGETLSVIYEIAMPAGPFVFGYAVDASWAPPLHKPVGDPMTEFGPEANCPEPWKIEVTGGDLGSAAQADLLIDVYDWSGKDSHTPPVLECPELFTGTITASWTQDGVGYSRYVATIHNELDPGQGQYECLVSVEDNDNDPVNKPWLDLTAYQVHEIIADVLAQKLPPVAKAKANPLVASINKPIHFQDDGSFDPDGGSITKYEWDWDNNGTYDDEGADMFHSWGAVGTCYVQFRVTDDELQTDELDQPIEIQISAGLGWAQTDFGNMWNHEVVSDKNGYLYVAGTGGNQIMSVAKVSSEGAIVWIYAFENEMSIADGIDIDASGNVYASGWFYGDVDFDSGPDEDIHTAVGDTDIFLVKLDNNGNYLWGLAWGGDVPGDSYNYESGHGVATDDSGGVYCCGDYRGYCDFDPGPGLAERTSNGSPDGAFDAFVTKFDENGQFQWIQTWGAPDSVEGATNFGDRATGVAANSSGDAFVLGGFLGAVDFDPGPDVDERTSSSEYGDVYLIKWNSSGDYQWVRTWSAIGGSYFPGTWQGWGGSTVTVDNLDNILAISNLDGTIDLDPGPGVFEHTGPGMALTKFDPDGNFAWANIWESSGLIELIPYTVNTDLQGNIFVAGGYSASSIDLNPGSGVDTHYATGWRNSCLVKLDQAGSFLWANDWGPTSTSYFCEAWGVCADEDGNSYACGYFRGSVDFDPGPGSDIHTASSFTGYLVKFLPDGKW